MTIRRTLWVALAVLALAGIRPAPARAVTQIYANIDFYDALSPYGEWVSVPRYGDCWAPYHQTRYWRPYTVGYWVDTDYGWMWVSQDPWGGLPYHYGRWVYDYDYGWVWVPDDDLVWAPAWVDWRYSDDYVGWAPLPPEADWGGSGLTVSVTYVSRRIPTTGWCFAPLRTFGTSRVRYSILPPTRNVTLLAQTRDVTRYVSYNSMPAERGLRTDLIERATGRRFQQYRITDARSPNWKSVNIQGRTIEAYRPRIRGAKERTQRFVTEARGRGGARGSTERQQAIERRNDQRIRQERDAAERNQRVRRNEQRVRDADMRRQRQEDMRQQREAEMRARQRGEERRGYEQRRKEETQRGGGGGGGGQYQRQERGTPPNQGQSQRGEDRGRGQPQGRGRGKGPNQDENKGQGQDQGQGQGQGQQDQNDQEKGHGRGRGHDK